MAVLSTFVAGATAAAGLGLAIGWGLAASQAPDDHRQTGSGTGVAGDHGGERRGSFSIRGRVGGLAPGRQTEIRVTVTNPNAWRLRLLTLTVAAKDASKKCRAEPNLRVGSYNSRWPFAREVVVARHGSATVRLPIRLVNAPDRNQDACKNVVFPLHYSGTAASMRR